MELLKPKARKALVKQVRKLIKQYGAEATVGIISGLVGTVVADVAGKKVRRKKVLEAAEQTAAAPGELVATPTSESPAEASPGRAEPAVISEPAEEVSSQPALASAAEPAPAPKKPRRKARPAPAEPSESSS